MSVPFQRAADAVRGAGAEAAAIAGHLVRYPTGVGDEPRPAPGRPCPPEHDGPAPGPGGAPASGRPHHGPVLFLHGFADNRAVFHPLLRALRRDGWTHLHALNHSPLTGDVRTAAVLLGRHVEWARRAHRGAPVALVGHSLGGLIARYYVQRLCGDEHVPTVITLAAPHEGTLAAHLPNPFPITRQMRPGSDLLAELRQPAAQCRTRFTAFWGELDEVVLPARNGRLRHPDLAAENIMVPGAGHAALPVDRRVVDGVRRILAAAEAVGADGRVDGQLPGQPGGRSEQPPTEPPADRLSA
ncbi:lipase [Kitasatospora herbaricolor]|uniref:esterase/lipase family protein n=1 Tax=Kitasatospora herbaricolor TaxID=68217 RepID=UPI00174C45D9|nr:alpha/beta fold hydrolase [Kitasatospora herbaricolor]MDQ0308805.1 pimeloyl-ACP methyl ester carboxylesterase [Kitasatospora herbaricolor]GGV10117.1 lipase [Kitasatospora herbaricolor]